ncbi:hypothetical protein ZWY2020_059694 [Hordeum vulgare]|nr:hypothetical protein ZWY2020_059694 [Hordeum vulgare]
MAASALKMAAICAVLLVILLSGAGQPWPTSTRQPALAPRRHACLAKCAPLCHEGAQVMCSKLCGLTPSGLDGVDQACVNHFVSSCMVACKNMCEPIPFELPDRRPTTAPAALGYASRPRMVLRSFYFILFFYRCAVNGM